MDWSQGIASAYDLLQLLSKADDWKDFASIVAGLNASYASTRIAVQKLRRLGLMDRKHLYLTPKGKILAVLAWRKRSHQECLQELEIPIEVEPPLQAHLCTARGSTLLCLAKTKNILTSEHTLFRCGEIQQHGGKQHSHYETGTPRPQLDESDAGA